MTFDPFDLQRFVLAQDGCFEAVRLELRAGRKETHWMWFVFPQLRGLGASPWSQRFGISGRGEALAYLAHPLLGARLVECTQLVAAAPRSVAEIFGHPDDRKFHSSMTLFNAVNPENTIFASALELFFGSVRDAATLKLLGAG